jgi:succinyl-CoA synthetase beta subunit
MNVHEYQAKEILKKYGVAIPDYAVVSSVDEAKEALDKLNLTSGVVKVQVHAGGRGKAGGVKLGHSREELLAHVDRMLGMKIVNNQTGPEGVVAKKLLIASLIDLKQEYYLGATIDRQNGVATLIASPEGGVEIEEVAATSPERILKIPIQPNGTLRRYQLLYIAKFMGWSGDIAKQGMKMISGLAKAFMETDASLLEINPLALSDDGKLLAVDAKLGVDENALFRQPELAAMYDPTQIPKSEVEALKHDLSYIALDGDIGCMVNGAGLAMSTMDIINHYGGKPANFLDVGGGATKEKIAEGFNIIAADKNVKAILVNIFGGIMNCVTISAGVIFAIGESNLHIPLVVRMEGTNVDEGRRMLADSGLDIIPAEGMADAAEKVVAASKQGK